MQFGNKLNVSLVLLAVVVLAIPSGLNSGTDAEDSFVLDVIAEHGTVLDVATGNSFVSGTVVADTVNLLFIANSGHEFVKWEINGNCKAVDDGISLSISALKEDVSITAITRNYSTSQELITVVDSYGTPVPGDTLVNSWAFRSTELNRTGSMWSGMPCTPLIVGDTVYVRAAGILYALDIHSGIIIKKVNSGGIPSFYHYISYGNGVIFDTMGHKAYDLDLNYLYDIPSRLMYASYHQGYFYGCLSTETTAYYRMYKTSVEVNKDLNNGVKINLFSDTTEYRIFAQYGQFSNVIFENGYFFFLQADRMTGTNGWRAMTAINLETEKSYTVELTGFTGMPWDDGWLSYYNGYFYLTAYTAGLFDGVIKGLENKRSSVMWAKFDFEKGVFEEPQYQNITTVDGSTFRGIASGLEIHDGRGYINVRALGSDTLGGSDDTGTCLIAFNIAADGRPVPTGEAPSPMTHGGIVVNTAYESEGKRYIYILPYNQGSQGLYVYTDELKDGVWTLRSDYALMSFNSSMNEYCSQAVRMGPSGEVVFYLDSGYIQCYVAAERYPFTVTTVHNGSAEVSRVYGKDIAAALDKLYPGYTNNNGLITISGTDYRLYGLNEVNWAYDEITELSISSRFSGTESFGITTAPYSQIVLLESGCDPHFSSKGEAGWYYFGDDGAVQCNIRSRDALDGAVGHTMNYYYENPDGCLIRYVFDGETVYFERAQSGTECTVREKEVKKGFDVSDWATDNVEIVDGKFVMPDGNVTFTSASKVRSYTVTYEVDGNRVGDIEIYEYGSTVTVRPAYQGEGVTVSRWSSPEVSLGSGTFTMPDKDLVISASSSPNIYNVEYLLDGVSYRTVSYVKGESCTVIPVAEVSEGTATVWISDDVQIEGGKFVMPGKDVVLCAVTLPSSWELMYSRTLTEILLPGTVATVDGPSVVSAAFDNARNCLDLKGLMVGSTSILLVIGGAEYRVAVDVVENVYTDSQGNTVTESYTETVNGYGGVSSTDRRAVTNDITMNREETVTVTEKDGNGNVLRTTVKATIVKDKDPDYTYIYGGRELPSHTETERTVVTVSGVIESDISEFVQRYSIWDDDGMMTSVVTTIVTDSVDGSSTSTTVESTVYQSYSVTKTKVQHPDGSTDVNTEIGGRNENLTVDVDGGQATVIVTDDAQGLDSLLEYLSGKGKEDGISDIEVKTQDTISGSNLDAVATSGATLTISSGGSDISLGSATVSALQGKGDVSFSFSDNVTLSSNRMKDAAGDATVFSLVLKCGNEEQHDFGSFTVSVACEVDIQEGKVLKVWRIDSSGNRIFADNVSYADGKVTFDANHLSYYAVGYLEDNTEEGSSGSNGSSIGIIAVVVIISLILVIAAVFYSRSKARKS